MRIVMCLIAMHVRALLSAFALPSPDVCAWSRLVRRIRHTAGRRQAIVARGRRRRLGEDHALIDVPLDFLYDLRERFDGFQRVRRPLDLHSDVDHARTLRLRLHISTP